MNEVAVPAVASPPAPSLVPGTADLPLFTVPKWVGYFMDTEPDPADTLSPSQTLVYQAVTTALNSWYAFLARGGTGEPPSQLLLQLLGGPGSGA